jgi:TusA-related sulfurtransferase
MPHPAAVSRTYSDAVTDDAGMREDGPALTTAPIVLDLTGPEDLCTQPGALERVRTAYAKLDPGERLEVRSTITEHAFAVRVWSRKHGVSVVADEAVDGYRRLVLEAPTAGV